MNIVFFFSLKWETWKENCFEKLFGETVSVCLVIRIGIIFSVPIFVFLFVHFSRLVFLSFLSFFFFLKQYMFTILPASLFICKHQLFTVSMWLMNFLLFRKAVFFLSLIIYFFMFFIWLLKRITFISGAHFTIQFHRLYLSFFLVSFCYFPSSNIKIVCFTKQNKKISC